MFGCDVGCSKLNGAEVCDSKPLPDYTMAKVDGAELVAESLVKTAELLEESTA